MEKTTGNPCPRCGANTLNTYYEDDSDLQMGVRCENCGLTGFFVGDRLVQVTTV